MSDEDLFYHIMGTREFLWSDLLVKTKYDALYPIGQRVFWALRSNGHQPLDVPEYIYSDTEQDLKQGWLKWSFPPPHIVQVRALRYVENIARLIPEIVLHLDLSKYLKDDEETNGDWRQLNVAEL